MRTTHLIALALSLATPLVAEDLNSSGVITYSGVTNQTSGGTLAVAGYPSLDFLTPNPFYGNTFAPFRLSLGNTPETFATVALPPGFAPSLAPEGTLSGGTLSGGSLVINNSSGSLVKNGAGTLTFSGVNTYTGTTTVSSGTLAVSVPTFADTSSISVASGAVLNLNFAGTDTVGSLVLNGVTQAPGIYDSSNSGGLITGTGSLTVPAPLETFGSPYLWVGYNWSPNISPQPGDDLLNINGSSGLTGTTTSNPLNVVVTPLNLGNVPNTSSFDAASSGYTWTIVSTTTGVTGFDANANNLDLNGFVGIGGWPANSWSVSTGGNDIQLVYVGDTSTSSTSTTSTPSLANDPNGDTDGDGVSNLLENAFGSDPLLPGGTRLPRPLLDLVDFETHAGLTYTRSKAALGITFTVEFSSTPADSGFAPAPVTETNRVDNGDGTETVTLLETAPSFGTRFARLRVIQN